MREMKKRGFVYEITKETLFASFLLWEIFVHWTKKRMDVS